jgi:hypothetical protein
VKVCQLLFGDYWIGADDCACVRAGRHEHRADRDLNRCGQCVIIKSNTAVDNKMSRVHNLPQVNLGQGPLTCKPAFALCDF